MKRNLNFALLLIIFFTSCKKELIEANRPQISSMAKASSTSSAIYVQVDLAAGNEIKDDGKGTYYHGVDRVDARILSDGNFFFQTNSNDLKAEIRKLNFEHPDNYVGFTVNDDRNYTMRTNATSSLLSMTAGQTQNVGFTVRGIDKGGVVDWILQYRNGIEAANTETDQARVTKNEDGSWTIEPANVSIVNYANAGLYHADTYGNAVPNSQNYYSMPFKLTIRKK